MTASLKRFWVATLLLGQLACPGAVGQAVRPKDPTYAQAVSAGRCIQPSDNEMPLVVDWEPQARGDLEVAMKQGIAVVAYDCKTLRVLPDCRVEGEYGFMGMTLKQQLIQLKNADELKTNLPLSGAILGAKLGAQLERGATLDVALVMVGKRVAARDHVDRSSLKGQCAGATHFVRSATLGAFVLKTGTRGKAEAVAEILGVGGTAASASDRDVQNRDGDPDACGKATPDATAPPPQCGALVRLHLAGLGAATTPSGMHRADVPCPTGMVFSEGKCTAPSDGVLHQCAHDDLADCIAQCDRGHAGSCMNLAVMLYEGHGVKTDQLRALALMDRACRAGHVMSCGNLGTIYLLGQAVEQDLPRAIGLFSQACDAGDAAACGNLGAIYWGVGGLPKNAPRAVTHFHRGCQGGDGASCHKLALVFETGQAGVAANPELALRLYVKACQVPFGRACLFGGRLYARTHGWQDGNAKNLHHVGCALGVGESCLALGYALVKGTDLPADPTRGMAYLQRGCDARHAPACGAAGIFLLRGSNGVLRDATRAVAFLGQACRLGHEVSCALFVKMGGRRPDPATPATRPSRAAPTQPAPPTVPVSISPTPSTTVESATVEPTTTAPPAPPATEQPAPPASEQPPPRTRHSGLLTGSIISAVVATGLATFAAFLTQQKATKAARDYDRPAFDDARLEQRVLYGVAGTLGAASVTMFVLYLTTGKVVPPEQAAMAREAREPPWRAERSARDVTARVGQPVITGGPGQMGLGAAFTF